MYVRSQVNSYEVTRYEKRKETADFASPRASGDTSLSDASAPPCGKSSFRTAAPWSTRTGEGNAEATVDRPCEEGEHCELAKPSLEANSGTLPSTCEASAGVNYAVSSVLLERMVMYKNDMLLPWV